MDGHGTDAYDNRRLDKLEKEQADTRKDLHSLAGHVQAIDSTLRAQSDLLRDINASLKQDKNKPPPYALFLSLATALAAAGWYYLQPVKDDVAELYEKVSHIQQTRWTRDDHDRAMRYMGDDLRDLKDWQQRQDDRLLDLERK